LPEGEKNSRNDYPSVRNQRFLTAPLTRGAFGCGDRQCVKLQLIAVLFLILPKFACQPFYQEHHRGDGYYDPPGFFLLLLPVIHSPEPLQFRLVYLPTFLSKHHIPFSFSRKYSVE
jgi:hypothetical protein